MNRKYISLFTIALVSACASDPKVYFEDLSKAPVEKIVKTPAETFPTSDATEIKPDQEIKSTFNKNDKIVYLDQKIKLRAPFKVFRMKSQKGDEYTIHFKSAAEIVGFGNGSIISPVFLISNHEKKLQSIKVLSTNYKSNGGPYQYLVDLKLGPITSDGDLYIFLAPDTRLQGSAIGKVAPDYPLGLVPALLFENGTMDQKIIPNVYGNISFKIVR